MKKIVLLIVSGFMCFGCLTLESNTIKAADSEWSDPGQSTKMDLIYRNEVKSAYYDGQDKIHKEWKLSTKGIFVGCDFTVKNLTTNTVLNEIHYNTSSVKVNAQNLAETNQVLEQLNDMMNVGREPGQYYFIYNYNTYNSIGAVGVSFSTKMNILKRPITITSSSVSKRDNGTPLSAAEYTINSNIPDGTDTLLPGHTIQVDVKGVQTGVGSSENTIGDVVILDENGMDVTKYYEIQKVPGTLSVSMNNAPVIHASDRTITEGEPFDPLSGVSAADVEDGNLQVRVIDNQVDVSKPGIYLVKYGCSDSDGLEVQKTIIVTVKKKDILPNHPDSDYEFTTTDKNVSKKVNTGDHTDCSLFLQAMLVSGVVAVYIYKKW